MISAWSPHSTQQSAGAEIAGEVVDEGADARRQQAVGRIDRVDTARGRRMSVKNRRELPRHDGVRRQPFRHGGQSQSDQCRGAQ